jgi:hypothetical protein
MSLRVIGMPRRLAVPMERQAAAAVSSVRARA